MGSSRTRDRTCVSCIGRRILIHCATREACVRSLCVCIVSLRSLPISLELVDLISSTWFCFLHCHSILCLGERRHPDCPVLGTGVQCMSVGTIPVLAPDGGLTLHRIKSCIIHVPIPLEFLKFQLCSLMFIFFFCLYSFPYSKIQLCRKHEFSGQFGKCRVK